MRLARLPPAHRKRQGLLFSEATGEKTVLATEHEEFFILKPTRAFTYTVSGATTRLSTCWNSNQQHCKYGWRTTCSARRLPARSSTWLANVPNSIQLEAKRWSFHSCQDMLKAPLGPANAICLRSFGVSSCAMPGTGTRRRDRPPAHPRARDDCMHHLHHNVSYRDNNLRISSRAPPSCVA